MAEKNIKKDNQQESLGEDWWASVLADEEVGQADQRASVVEVSEQSVLHNIPAVDKNDWNYVTQVMDEDRVVSCEVKEFNQGGLIVSNRWFHGFVPVSHLVKVPQVETDQERLTHLRAYLGTKMNLRVIECKPRRGRIVLSERAAQAAPGQRRQLLETLEKGIVYHGTITNITDFGVFIDLGGVEGLAHISELSWGRVKNPGHLFKIGEEVEVLVLQVDQENAKVSLSIKRLKPNPWEQLEDQFPPGSVFSVTVSRVVDFGAFVRLPNNLEGLIHISEMGLLGDDTPKDILAQGEEVIVEIVTVDITRQRLSLRLKE